MNEPSNTLTNSSGPTIKRVFVVENKLGLHARPSALIIKTLQPFRCEVTIESRGETVNGRSILGLLTLAAGYGTQLNFTAIGDDAAAALAEIERLFASNFAEAY